MSYFRVVFLKTEFLCKHILVNIAFKVFIHAQHEFYYTYFETKDYLYREQTLHFLANSVSFFLVWSQFLFDLGKNIFGIRPWIIPTVYKISYFFFFSLTDVNAEQKDDIQSCWQFYRYNDFRGIPDTKCLWFILLLVKHRHDEKYAIFWSCTILCVLKNYLEVIMYCKLFQNESKYKFVEGFDVER